MKFLSLIAALLAIVLLVAGYFDDQRTLTKVQIKRELLEIEKLELELPIYREQASVNVSVE